MSSTVYSIIQPITIWEDNICVYVGPVCEPQHKAKKIGIFPKTDPNAKTNALLFKQVLYKWRSENRISK